MTPRCQRDFSSETVRKSLIFCRFYCIGYISLDNRCLSNYIVRIAGGAQTMTIYDPASYEFRSGIPQLIGRIRAAYITELEERLAPFNLKAADYLVLVFVANDIDTAAAVCSLMAHDPGAMTRKIDALEERGLVRRVRSAEDRRAIRLELTPEGKKLYPKILAVAVGLANESLRGFTKSEARDLEDKLKRVLLNAESFGVQEEPLKVAKVKG
jgi:DNA-binding MarR family transcriptional regulator